MRAFYGNTVHGFLGDDPNLIIGRLTERSAQLGLGTIANEQVNAWHEEIVILKAALQAQPPGWSVLLEYPIPRRGSRIDTVLLGAGVVAVIEFKVFADSYSRAGELQVEDYALDLRDFHRQSRNLELVPILVATEARDSSVEPLVAVGVSNVLRANRRNLGDVLSRVMARFSEGNPIDQNNWDSSLYEPTPTIIEAAQHLYAGHNVVEIARCHAGSDNLQGTTDAVLEAISDCQASRNKAIIFVTGVPGAGKTLAGLNIVHNRDLHEGKELGVFLSGNGPLVRVLREALAQDDHRRTGKTLNEARRQVKTFIQNVHHLLTDHFDPVSNSASRPSDHIVVFDEAQRAWDRDQSRRKFKRDFSEPEMLLRIMDQHDDWAAIVALVGGGQEINTGEAGLREWGDQLQRCFQHWNVYVSPELLTGHHAAGGSTLFETAPDSISTCKDARLHLRVSLRSFRADALSEWIQHVLDGKCEAARRLLHERLSAYPLYVTRDLAVARGWLRRRTRGTRRAGVIASSKERRIRPHGLEVQSDMDVAKWFLAVPDDIRSSSFLELPATEFDVQGLELDYACVCWGADLRKGSDGWQYYSFEGSSWRAVRQQRAQTYLLNSYRVLLSRAREGMVIWVPPGDATDLTRDRGFYDPSAKYLEECGVTPLV